jgi:mRNA interferase MazF
MKPTVASLRRGDIVLVLYPNSDLRTAKTRPAVVVQADRLQTGLHQVVLAMITSRMDRSGHPSRVRLLLASPSGRNSGLLRDSVVMTDNLATVLETALERHIGSVSMSDVDAALRHTLGL